MASLIVVFHIVMEILYPILILFLKDFNAKKKKEKKKGGKNLISVYLASKKTVPQVDKELLKTLAISGQCKCQKYIKFTFLVIYSIGTASVNYPLALMNCFTTILYLRMCSPCKNNSLFKNIILIGIPFLGFNLLGLIFYLRTSYVNILRYMIIEYQTVAAPVYSYIVFNLVAFVHCVYKILL